MEPTPGKPTHVTYRTPDGINIIGVVTTASKGQAKGNVVLTHGLNNNKDEDGYFVKLSELLSSDGYDVLRFDFRGHGESGGRPEEMTVTGELADLEASVAYLERLTSNKTRLMFVASSFGAASVILFSSRHQDTVKKVALWNPVLDFRRTFLQAEVEWGRTFFNEDGYRELESKGYITIPETDFRLGRMLIAEFGRIQPFRLLQQLNIPVLTIHGTLDTSVPYIVSKEYGTPNPQSKFISLDTDHTFPGMEDFVIRETFKWLTVT